MPASRVLLAGFGYCARRLAVRLDATATPWQAHSRSGAGASRALDLDLDLADAAAPAEIDAAACAVVYSIAPAPNGHTDARLSRWLGLLRGKPRRMVYLSTTGVYGHRPGEIVTEATSPQPAQARSALRLAAETAMSDWCKAHAVPLVVLRLPAIYGPGQLPLARIERGDPVLDPAVAPPSYRIHVDDVAAAMARALHDDLPPGTYLLRDDSDWSLGGWFLQVAAIAGLAAPPIVSLAEAQARLSPAMLGFMTEYRRLDDSHSRRALGLSLQWPDPRDGVRASLAATG